ncbi:MULTISPECIES: hypothetical protein [Kribbella]|uniref:hypothetical protein n=1 Tax=Kribbella TaxID=182639 RepID=UPI00104415CD|nr:MULTISPECIES: hypothetical protein [Kribbella]
MLAIWSASIAGDTPGNGTEAQKAMAQDALNRWWWRRTAPWRRRCTELARAAPLYRAPRGRRCT